MEKKVIHSSHLALRFYSHQGWTEENLRPYLLKGDIEVVGSAPKDRGDPWSAHFEYWRLKCQGMVSSMDVNKLAEDCRVFDYKNRELFGEEAKKYLNELNW